MICALDTKLFTLASLVSNGYRFLRPFGSKRPLAERLVIDLVIDFVNSFYFSFQCFASVVRIVPYPPKEAFLRLLRSIGGGRRRHSDDPSEALR